VKTSNIKNNFGLGFRSTKCDAPLNSYKDPNVGPRTKQRKEKNKNWGTFPNSQHFQGRRAYWSFGMGVNHTDMATAGSLNG
jgi:hypothetical protein